MGSESGTPLRRVRFSHGYIVQGEELMIALVQGDLINVYVVTGFRGLIRELAAPDIQQNPEL